MSLDAKIAALEKQLLATQSELKDLETMLLKLMGRSSAFHNAVASLVALHHDPSALSGRLEQSLLLLAAQADDSPSDEYQKAVESAKHLLLLNLQEALNRS